MIMNRTDRKFERAFIAMQNDISAIRSCLEKITQKEVYFSDNHLSIKEVAQKLKVSRTTVNRMVERGDLSLVYLDNLKRKYISKTSLDNYIKDKMTL